MFLDTANIKEVQKYKSLGIIKGVTTNPTILSKEKSSRNDQLKLLLAEEMPIVFVQLLGETYEEFLDDAAYILKAWKNETTIGIKVPLNLSGLQIIHYLKEHYPEKKILGTAIYSADQAILGSLAGCDYLAVYVNRMENNNLNPYDSIAKIRHFIDERKLPTEIMAASFKNTNQILDSLDAGAHTVTVPSELFGQMINKELAINAIRVFNKDGKLYN